MGSSILLTSSFKGSLVSIHDDETNIFIQSLAPNKIWIGGERLGNKSKGRSQLNPHESHVLCKCEKIHSNIYIANCFHKDLVAISLMIISANVFFETQLPHLKNILIV